MSAKFSSVRITAPLRSVASGAWNTSFTCICMYFKIAGGSEGLLSSRFLDELLPPSESAISREESLDASLLACEPSIFLSILERQLGYLLTNHPSDYLPISFSHTILSSYRTDLRAGLIRHLSIIFVFLVNFLFHVSITGKLVVYNTKFLTIHLANSFNKSGTSPHHPSVAERMAEILVIAVEV